MPGLSSYERECITLDKDEMKEGWSLAISRLGREWNKIESEKEELKNAGIYITTKEDLSEFTLMIFKEKDGGPYNYTPLYFTIKPCKNKITAQCYPLIPPIVRFHSFDNKYIHPNLKHTGDVCISLLEYSYVGGGVAQWNPSMGIKAIAITLSSMIEEGALRKEPSFSKESLTSPKTIEYDQGAQYLCMSQTLKVLSSMNDALFKEVLLEKKNDILNYVLTNTNERNDVYINTYGFKLNTGYTTLNNRAKDLARNDPHSN
jgi:ubiquitin-protein ligase